MVCVNVHDVGGVRNILLQANAASQEAAKKLEHEEDNSLGATIKIVWVRMI